MNIISYITAHWTDISAALFLFVATCRIIVKLTPTPKDDTALEAVVDFLKHLGLVVKDKAPLILACFCLLTMTSCGTTATGEKTFLGLTSKQGLTIFGDAIKREALPVASDVMAARATNSAKTPVKVTP